MAHSTQIGKTTFVHNGDFSGNVTIIRENNKLQVEITLPFKDLVDIVAERKRDLLISELEQLNTETILDTKLIQV